MKYPFWPLLLIVIGVLFLLENLGALPVPLRELIRTWWPLILIVAGVAGLMRRK